MIWLDENTGLAAVPNFEASGIYRTTDGGLNWNRVSETSARHLTSGPDSFIGAVDSYHTFFQESGDGGISWVSHTPPFSSANAGYPGSVESLQAVENGYIIGGSGNRLLLAEREYATGLPFDQNDHHSKTENKISITPNPVRDFTVIHFEKNEKGPVSIGLYDARGIFVYQIINQNFQAGSHEISFNMNEKGQYVKPGLYFVLMKTNENISSVKIIVMN